MKISSTLLNNMINKNCTSKEIDLLIYIVQFQLPDGFVQNIYYKDVCTSCNMPASTFYRCLNRLVDKKILYYHETERNGYFNIQIYDNDFSDKLFQESYVNINRPIFFLKTFKTTTAKIKLILLKLFCRNLNKYRTFKVNIKNLLGVIKVKHITKDLCNKYIELLSYICGIYNLFDLQVNNTVINITVNNDIRIKRSEPYTMQKHIFKSFCKKSKVSYNDKDIEDLIQMDNEYVYYNADYKNVVKNILLKERVAKCSTIRSKMKSIIQKYTSYNYLGVEMFYPI